MSEPRSQVEIQLGHMCNNRCVFCVSGQRTDRGEAKPMEASPLLERIEDAARAGHKKITLLGGEPTLQPAFLDVVRRCGELGFEEVVVFTNGVKTAREQVIDATREALGPNAHLIWRISIQGATEASHVRTTQRPNSFKRILRTLDHLKARGEDITVNMCVVRSNHADLEHFAELLLPYGARQLHLDMVRPLDAGDRTEAEMEEMLVRYTDLAEPMRRMVAAFEERAPGFDVNIGNLPYCVAPDLIRWIHHDGEHTETVAIDHDDQLSEPWDKYEVKRRDKLKAPGCAECVMNAECNGVFETYARFHGLDELRPLSADDVPADRIALAPSVAARLERLRRAAPFGRLEWVGTRRTDDGVEVSLQGPQSERAVFFFEEKAGRASGGYRVEGDPTDALREGVRAAMVALKRLPLA
ncbi:MAG: radical SAM protein [Deltaproteobacteria bacterium]|nr:radical SAM protein [Deltaproteobacteria bacterium]